MEQLPEEVRGFLQQYPNLQLIPGNKVRCTLTGHELACRLPELLSFTSGKKFQRLTSASCSFNYSSFGPHIVPSSKNPKQLFCKLTLRHLNKIPEHVQRHTQGKRYTKALRKYEECKKQGVEFVPACLKNRNKPKNWGDEQRAGRKDVWEPPASDSEESDSGDSMSDLYPAQMFPRKNPEKKEDDEFQTDSDEMEMEIDSTQKDDKRQQRQKGPARKKFKNRHQKSKPYKKPAAK